MTRNEAKLTRDSLYRTAKARGALPPSPEQATVQIEARGGVRFAPGTYGFPDASVLRCLHHKGGWSWTAFACDPIPNLRHTTTAHK